MSFFEEPTIEETLIFSFDGGCSDNGNENATCYGSYVQVNSKMRAIAKPVRLTFSKETCSGKMTNNSAEMLSLISILSDLLKASTDRTRTRLIIFGDSELALGLCSGRMFSDLPHLKDLAMKFKTLKSRFGEVDLQWHGRENNVRLLGH